MPTPPPSSDPSIHDAEADPALAGEDDSQQQAASGWTGWLISFSFHSLLILLLSGVYWLVRDPEADTPPVRVATIDEPPKKDPPKPETLLETKVELNITTPTTDEVVTPITQIEVAVEQPSSEDEAVDPNASGRLDAVANSEMGGSGAFIAIGAAGGGSGMFANRGKGNQQRALGHGGGNQASQNAVEAALRWFKKHQSQNGMWDHAKYAANCGEDPKCEPGGDQAGTVDAAMTGYALLCYLGAGFDHASANRYKLVVKKGLDYLLSIQQPDGLFGARNYENAVATMAVAEAYAMTGDPSLKEPAQKGVNAILAHQNQAGAADAKKDEGYGSGFGWDYVGPDTRNDSSVSGWNVMALKSAMAGQLNIGNGMEGAKRWLETTWKKANPDWARLDPYTGESRYPYAFMTDTQAVTIAAPPAAGAPSSDQLDLTCVGAVCAVFLGHHAGDPMLETLSNYIMNHETPSAYPCNTYKMYYNTMTMFQVGGERWKKWNGSVRDMLVSAQRKGQGCFDGSWDYAGTRFPGSEVGRVLSTAYCCLSLEVYYRYMQAQKK